jgi:hypothetical protein
MQCISCQRYGGALGCEAYPGIETIPEEILTGEPDHREPFPGDHGLRLEGLTHGSRTELPATCESQAERGGPARWQGAVATRGVFARRAEVDACG